LEPSKRLQQAIQENLLELRRTKTLRPLPEDSKRIAAVSGASVAGAAGLREGDWLVSIDGRPGHECGTRLYAEFASRRHYLFYAHATGESVDLETSGVEIGVRLQPTVPAIVAHWDPVVGDPAALVQVWEAGEWEVLQKLSWMRCRRSRKPPGLLSRLSRITHRDTPALALLGAALWERGRKRRGMALLDEYAAEHAGNWPDAYLAVATYYLALRHLGEGYQHRALKFLRKSLNLHPFDRVAALHTELSEEPLPKKRRSWVTRPFPVDYDLEPLDVDPALERKVSLPAALRDMRTHQLLLVCLLGDDRGNEAYDDFVLRYLNYYTWLPGLFAGLHVITTTPERQVGEPWWDAEDMAHADGLPVAVLLDEYGHVPDRVHPPASPTVYALDSDGTVLHEGLLDPVDMWDALALASVKRPV